MSITSKFYKISAKATVIILILAMVIILMPGYTAEANREPVFGIPRVSGNSVVIPAPGIGGRVNYILERHGSTIYEWHGNANGSEVTLPLPNGLTSGLYSIIIWPTSGIYRNMMTSFEVRLNTGSPSAKGWCGCDGLPGVSCRNSIRVILAPSAVLYADEAMTQPKLILNRYDRVVVGQGGANDLILKAWVELPNAATGTKEGWPGNSIPVLDRETELSPEKYEQIVNLDPGQGGFIYSYTTRHAHSFEDEEIIQDIISVALSRRGFHGLYNQSLRHHLYYLDCAAFVDQVFRINGIRFPSGLAGLMAGDLVKADNNVFSKHETVGDMVMWGNGEIPEYDSAKVRNLTVTIKDEDGEVYTEEGLIDLYNSNEHNGVFFYEPEMIIGQHSDAEAGDTVATGPGPVEATVRWEEYVSYLIDTFCANCRTNGWSGGNSQCPHDTYTQAERKNSFTIGSSGLNIQPCVKRKVERWLVKAETFMVWHITNERIMGVNHIMLYIGDGFTLDGTSGFGDTIEKGNTIHSTSPRVKHEDWAYDGSNKRILHIGRPVEELSWRFNP